MMQGKMPLLVCDDISLPESDTICRHLLALFPGTLISRRVVLKSFCKREFPHKSVNLFFILVIVKDKLTDLWGS